MDRGPWCPKLMLHGGLMTHETKGHLGAEVDLQVVRDAEVVVEPG